MWTFKLQALVYNILPSTTAIFSYTIGSRKLSANEQFFVGAQTVESLLQTTQIISDVCFIMDHVAYTCSNKTKIVWIDKIVSPRLPHPTTTWRHHPATTRGHHSDHSIMSPQGDITLTTPSCHHKGTSPCYHKGTSPWPLHCATTRGHHPTTTRGHHPAHSIMPPQGNITPTTSSHHQKGHHPTTTKGNHPATRGHHPDHHSNTDSSPPRPAVSCTCLSSPAHWRQSPSLVPQPAAVPTLHCALSSASEIIRRGRG